MVSLPEGQLKPFFKKHLFAIAILFIASIGSIIALIKGRPDGLLRVYFLNIGQGDAIFVRTPTGENLLIDGGPDRSILSELDETLPYFDRTIDYLVLTHPDRDHLQGFIPVLKRYPIRRALLTGVTKKNPIVETFLSTLSEKNVAITFASAKNDLRFGNVTFDILYPEKLTMGNRERDTNSTSLIIKLIYGENEILFTGDSTADEENRLLRQGINLQADILKVSHHGSKTGTTDAFLKKVAPRYAIISVGKRNRYGHPHESVLKNLWEASVKVLRTDESGRIEFVFEKKGIKAIKIGD